MQDDGQAAADRLVEVIDRFRRASEAIRSQIGRAIVGQDHVIGQMLAVVFARGHALMVGVPGLAKTMMVNCLADVLDLKFKRIQFTPDLMPSDITGTNVLEDAESGSRRFRFVEGPLFANIVLADEINRAPPKTQAALLEAMQEHQVTVGQETHRLAEPFFVIATQNPIEQEGTYPLPEAQLDRFMFDVHIDYPSEEEERRILALTTTRTRKPLKKVLTGPQIRAFQRVVDKVFVASHIVAYVTRLVRATRPRDPSAPPFVRELVDWGAGPRAGQYLILGAKALAAMQGRMSISLEDVREVAVPVLRHRIATNFRAQAEGLDTVECTRRLLREVPEPEVRKYR